MKTRFIFIILVLIFVLPNVSHAQFGVVRRAINRQVDHKIDSSIEKSAQDDRDKKAKEESEQAQKGDTASKGTSASKSKSTGLFGGKIDIKYNDEYEFTGRIYMLMETYDKDDVTKSDFYTYYNTGTKNAGINLQTVDPKDGKTVISTSFLFDHDNRAFMSLLTADPKMGTITPVVTKTGKSRTIAGYKCDEYKVVEPDKGGYSMVWMTKDLKIMADKRYWGTSGMPTYYNYPGFEGSVMLAMEEYDKDNKLAVKMETKEINDNFNHSISTVGYKFSKVNFGMGGKSGKK
jgi:hypothetical protein